MEDNQPKTETSQEMHLREHILQMHQEFEAFFKQMEETIQDPTVENLVRPQFIVDNWTTNER